MCPSKGRILSAIVKAVVLVLGTYEVSLGPSNNKGNSTIISRTSLDHSLIPDGSNKENAGRAGRQDPLDSFIKTKL